MFFRILLKSFTRRRSRVFVAVSSVIAGATVATALLSIYLDTNERVSYEFRKYGANLIVVPTSDTIELGLPGIDFGSVTEQRFIDENDLWRIKAIYWRRNVLGFAPFLYQVVRARYGNQKQNVVLAGTYFNKSVEILEPYSPEDERSFTTGVRAINPWWEVVGKWIEDPDDSTSCIVGVNVAEKLGLELGDVMTVSYPGTAIVSQASRDLTVVGIVRTGGNEDNQILVNLQLAQGLTNRSNKLHMIQASALCTACPVETFAEEIEEQIPNIDARSARQVVSAEMAILDKFESVMLIVTLASLLASGLGVMTTTTASVIERQKEIGLMKSIGAFQGQIVSLFLSEAGMIGLLGGLLGYGVGMVLARFVGLYVFDVAVRIHPSVLLAVAAISVGVSLAGSILPARRALAIEPAVVLRGE